MDHFCNFAEGVYWASGGEECEFIERHMQGVINCETGDGPINRTSKINGLMSEIGGIIKVEILVDDTQFL